MTPASAMASSVVAASRSRLCARGSSGLYSMLIWQSRIVLGDLADAFDFPVPGLGVVELEIVIEAVLAEPDRHQLDAHRTGGIDAALGQLDRLLPHGFIRICEGAELEAGIGVVAHGQAIDRQTQLADAT